MKDLRRLTVAELRKALKGMPQNATVSIHRASYLNYNRVGGVVRRAKGKVWLVGVDFKQVRGTGARAREVKGRVYP